MRSKWVKKALSLALTAAMTVTMIPTNGMIVSAEEVAEGITEDVEASAATTGKFINLDEKSKEDGGITLWSDGNNASCTYDSTSVTIDSGWWGKQDWWTVQWAVQNIDLSAGDYVAEFDIVSTFDKTAYYKVTENSSDTPIIEESLELKKDEVKHIAADVTIEADGTYRIFFNLGGGESTTGTVKISNVSVHAPFINLEEKSKEDGGITLWSDGDNASCTYDSTSVKIESGWWGKQDWWTVQWAVQNIDLSAGKTAASFDIVSTFDKVAYYKVTENTSDTPIVEGTVDLKANEVQNIVTEVEIPADGTYRIFFNLGGGESTTGSVTISNVVLGAGAGSVVVDTSTGKEYDFAATEENKKNDYADPKGVPSALEDDDYELIWADEFDGNYAETANVDEITGLNLDNWAYQLGDGSTDCGNTGWGNKELQCYTSNKENISVNEDLDGDGNADGLLRITAKREAEPYVYEKESGKNYTSARIRTTSHTKELFNTTYGYIEGRISLPQTKGAWPAFWMLPQSTEIYGGWPVSGEIDIMETVGNRTNEACSTLHWGAPEHVYKGSGYTALASDMSYFHTYAVDWEPGKCTFYYDGKPIHTLENWESGFSGASDTLSFDAPFDQPFYMLLNLAVDSGQFGGTANKAAFEGNINMYVDYVRAYQRKDGYADEVIRKASGSTSDNWVDFAGKNQIAELTKTNVIAPEGEEGGMNDKEADMDKWYLSFQNDATDAKVSTIEKDGKAYAKVDVTTKGSKDYSVQLIGHYNAMSGYLYRVSFDAFAEGDIVGKTVNCDSKEWAGWSTFGIKSFELTEDVQHVEYLVNQTEDFERTRIEFNLGAQASGSVYIGNVKVEIVDPALLGEDGEVGGALSDGNVIYNGTFDQGNNHIGYWEASKGTTLSVPRYTKEALTEDDVKVVDVASKTNYEKIADGVKYYERRAQISAAADVAPQIFQPGIKMIADAYTLKFDMYSKADTTVTAAIYSTVDGALANELVATTAAYKAADGVKTFTWPLKTTMDAKEVALVLTFGKGASVQVDNVTMIGASQGEQVDTNPIKPDSEWSADDSNGNKLELTVADGVTTLENITSKAGTWYSPQIGSVNYNSVAGKTYKLSVKFKLEGSNGKVKYIIQENGGSWTIVQDVVEIDTADMTADEDGFFTYTTQFNTTTSVKNVHVNFGLGDSEMDGTGKFSFKDFDLSVVESIGSDEGDTGIEVMPETKTVTYVMNDDEANPATNNAANILGYIKSQAKKKLEDPTRPGYVFTGWYSDKDLKNKITELDLNQDAITVYAGWTKNSTSVPETVVKTNEITGLNSSYSARLSSKKIQLNAKATSGAVTYTSSNTRVATVDATGKVTLKGYGTAKITVTAAATGYQTVTKTVTVKVTSAVKISKLSSSKAGRLTIKWKKDSSAKGYQVQYSTKKSFSNKKTKTITKNKTVSTTVKVKSGKKYYVRVRAYKTVNGKKTYSSWTSVKSKTVK